MPASKNSLPTPRFEAVSAPGTLEVLLVADEGSATAALADSLGETGRIVHTAITIEEAGGILERRRVGLVILDLLAGGSDGRQLLTWMRESSRTSAVPAIVVAPRMPAGIERECRAMGAVDVLVTPVSVEQMEFSVAAVLERHSGESSDSLVDPVTGLPNRAAFREQFDLAVSLLAGTGEPLSMALISFEGLDAVGGGLSRAASDEILLACIETARRRFRRSDTLAAWDDGTFALLLPDTDCHGAARACRDTAAAIGERRFAGPGGERIPMKLVAGCVDVGEDGSLGSSIATAARCLFKARAAEEGSVVTPETATPIEPSRVLVIASDATVGTRVSRGLEGAGLKAMCHAETGKALRASREDGIDLVALQLDRPGDAGLEILRDLAQGVGRESSPVLLIALQGAGADIARGLEMGADDFIVAPFSSHELQSRVFRLLQRPSRFVSMVP